MDSLSEPTILDIAYELVIQKGPLSPEQMALTARSLGYDIAGWEFQADIEQHMLVYGEASPFIEVGYDQFGVWEEEGWQAPVPVASYQPNGLDFQTAAAGSFFPPSKQVFDKSGGPLDLIFPAAAAIAVTLALILAVLTGGPQQAITRAANSLFLPSTTVESDALEPILPASSEAEPMQSSISLDPTWWFSNTINQMNQDTQAVAREYLSNYYNTCGPAVVSMLATFLLAQSEIGGGPVSTASVLHDARNRLGYYTPPYNSGLLTFDHLRAMLELYGVKQVYPEGEGSLLVIEELLDRVRQGQPAIAGMRYHYQGDWQYLPSGGSGIYNHFVVVFALEQVDGQEYLWVANPHPGKYLISDAEAAPVRMSVDEFWQSWAIKDGSGKTNFGHAAFFGG